MRKIVKEYVENVETMLKIWRDVWKIQRTEKQNFSKSQSLCRGEIFLIFQFYLTFYWSIQIEQSDWLNALRKLGKQRF